jgi:hypothetical protein
MKDESDNFFNNLVLGVLILTALSGFGLTMAGLLGFKVDF